MIRSDDIFETIRMFQDEKLDVRTVTLGLNLDDCSSPVLAQLLDKIQAKIVGTAGGLVRAVEAKNGDRLEEGDELLLIELAGGEVEGEEAVQGKFLL